MKFLTFMEQNWNCHVEALRKRIAIFYHCEETGSSADDFEPKKLEVAEKMLSELERARECLAKAVEDGDVDALDALSVLFVTRTWGF